MGKWMRFLYSSKTIFNFNVSHCWICSHFISVDSYVAQKLGGAFSLKCVFWWFFQTGLWIVTATSFIQFDFSAELNWLNGNDYDSCKLHIAHKVNCVMKVLMINEITNDVEWWNTKTSNIVVIFWYIRRMFSFYYTVYFIITLDRYPASQMQSNMRFNWILNLCGPQFIFW